MQKARRAQNAGAKLLVVVDNVYEDLHEILVSDDGTGGDITIPAMLIAKHEGETLLKYLRADQTKERNFVTLRAVFDTWQQPRVQYDLYFATSQLYFYQFLAEMAEFHKLLGPGQQTAVVPHFRVHGFSAGIVDADRDCLAQGKYCLFSDTHATGRQLLAEQLRQLCILNANQDFAPGGPRTLAASDWFLYVGHFHRLGCRNDDAGCAERALRASHLSVEGVGQCVERATAPDPATGEPQIAFFDHEVQEWARTWNNVLYPAVTINRFFFKGNLVAEDVFRMICASFTPAAQPQGCRDFYREPAAGGGGGGGGGSTGLTVGAIIAIVILIVLINVVAICCYRRYAKREQQTRLTTEINSAVSAYFALNERDR